MSDLQVLRAALQLLADESAWRKGLVLGRHEAGECRLKSTSPPPPLVSGTLIDRCAALLIDCM